VQLGKGPAQRASPDLSVTVWAPRSASCPTHCLRNQEFKRGDFLDVPLLYSVLIGHSLDVPLLLYSVLIGHQELSQVPV